MKIVFMIFIAMLLGSCQVEEDTYTLENSRIKEALDRRKAAYAEVFMKNCTRDINEQADKYVDSLVTAEISFRVSDEVVFPAKPGKPVFENPDIFQDSLRALPIFPNKKLE
jgi:hypothetical protein